MRSARRPGSAAVLGRRRHRRQGRRDRPDPLDGRACRRDDHRGRLLARDHGLQPASGRGGDRRGRGRDASATGGLLGAARSRCRPRAGWPSFDGAAGWLNSEPLTREGLRGKVVLVDFWTYTCINWLRTLAYVRAWPDRYASDGLVVVGVHTPEFPFERDVDNVRRAVAADGRPLPGRARPRLRGLGGLRQPLLARRLPRRREGQIRHHHFGEGGYDEQERAIQQLLGVEGELSPSSPTGFEVQADWENLGRPRPTSARARARTRRTPGELSLNQWSLEGDWTSRRARGARPRRGPALVPLPRPRRPAGDGAARAAARRCRSACCSTASRRRGARARRRRGRPRRGDRAAPPPADPPARRDRRPDARARVPRSAASRPTASRSARR